MDNIKQFCEYTRELECHLENMNKTDCCQCSISESQCFLIVEIGRKPGISVKELANTLKLDKSGVSRYVEELVQKELVERKPYKEDRRYVALTLTEKGQVRFEKIEHDMYLKFKQVFDNIPKNMQGQVMEALKVYNEACTRVEENRFDQKNGKQ